jgi:hypothetical protein
LVGLIKLEKFYQMFGSELMALKFVRNHIFSTF